MILNYSLTDRFPFSWDQGNFWGVYFYQYNVVTGMITFLTLCLLFIRTVFSTHWVLCAICKSLAVVIHYLY